MFSIRRAAAEDAQTLTGIAVAAKKHWPYPPEQLEAWRADLTITADAVAATPVFLAEADGSVAGFFQLLPQGETWVLEHMWVLPEHMRKGLGRALLQHAAGLAAEGGAARLAIDADPHAEAFYAACGAATAGRKAAPIPGMPDRVRPQMVLPLPLAAPEAHRCPVCGNGENNRIVVAREMMFGMRDRFRYLDCGACRGVFLLDVPKDLAPYYPANYYSFAQSRGIKWQLKKRWAACSHGKWNPLGWLIELAVGPHVAIGAIRRARIAFDARVLDVGCGNGLLLRYMKHIGYRKVSGADPFIDADVSDEDGLLVRKRSLEEMRAEEQEKFDVIMFHHSFEHLQGPDAVLKSAVGLLNPGGRILIRLPVGGCLLWRRYGIDWINLDAPRHLYLFSPRSLHMLAQRCGLAVAHTSFEGSAASFVGSDLYARDVPLVDHASRARGGLGAFGLWRAARKYRAAAAQSNGSGEGDCACFELRVPA